MNNENGIRFWLVSYKFCFTFLFSNLRFQYGLADTFLVFQLFAFHQISANPIGLRPSICMPLSSLFLTGAARERRQEYDQPPLEERRELWSNRRPQASRRLIHSWWQMLDWMSDRFLEKHLSSEQESPASLSLSLPVAGDPVPILPALACVCLPFLGWSLRLFHRSRAPHERERLMGRTRLVFQELF